MRLIVCEKPSVAKSVAEAIGARKRQEGYLEGGGYLVSWCFGHLLGLAEASTYDEKYAKWRYDDLPILPDEWKYTVANDRVKQLRTLSSLMKRADVETIINGCDAGREGELIFRLVYEHCHPGKPIERLWINSMEEQAILDGMKNLKPGVAYDSLYHAALCRAQADWLVGINASRLFSVLYNASLSVGRVQSPTLAILVEREAVISAFIKEPFYTMNLDCGTFTASSEKFKVKNEAERIRAACDSKAATVIDIQSQEKSVAAPKLYDLTSLQRDANKLLGFTAQQTLDYAQSLYEKKLITYPRTDSRYLTEDMGNSIPALISIVSNARPFLSSKSLDCNAHQIIDNSKVSDHHALIPTMSIRDADLSALPSGEMAVLDLIVVRLLCAVSAKHSYSETTAAIECEGYSFSSKGKTILNNGWKEIDECYRASLKEKPPEDTDEPTALPELAEGQSFDNVSASIKEGFTSPPKRFTEDTLLAAMESAGAEDMPEDAERKGLGTPATRAGIIERLVSTGMIERKKKQMLPTDKGKNLVAVLPANIKSPTLTAEWEHQLKEIERGALTDISFMNGITNMVKQLVAEHAAPDPAHTAMFPSNKYSESVGKCPRCGRDVVEGTKGFFCVDKSCGFALWKDNRFFTAKKKAITKSIATALLKEGRVFLSGLYSEKTGKTYDATIILDDTGGKYVNFRMEFSNTSKKTQGGKKRGK